MASTTTTSNTISVTLADIAKRIDHSLLHPTMTDDEVRAGLQLAKKYDVAAACVKPYSIPLAKEVLAGSDVQVCAVIGFPHGNSTTKVKVFETVEAAEAGATEIDMVVNVGKVLGGDWDYIEREVEAINRAAVDRGAILKVIFENDFLADEHIVRLCDICRRVGVAYVKTSTGYGFVKQPSGQYAYRGATPHHLKLMKQHCGPDVKVKAAGGVRTLDEFLHVMSLGVERVGASATAAVLDEASRKGISETPKDVVFRPMSDSAASGAY